MFYVTYALALLRIVEVIWNHVEFKTKSLSFKKSISTNQSAVHDEQMLVMTLLNVFYVRDNHDNHSEHRNLVEVMLKSCKYCAICL